VTDVEWLRSRLAPGDTLLAAAKSADDAINNQSLVVLFTIHGKTMLFVGDAQWGNWSSFLFGKALVGKEQSPLLPSAESIMKGLDFYKVGHHGSTNATPIDAVDALGDHCVAMCCTQEGCYGKKDETKVPRSKLMEELGKKVHGQLVRSDEVPTGTVPKDEAAAERAKVVAPPKDRVLSKNFELGKSLYIDYWLPSPPSA
jgi:hypothetical protein